VLIGKECTELEADAKEDFTTRAIIRTALAISGKHTLQRNDLKVAGSGPSGGGGSETHAGGLATVMGAFKPMFAALATALTPKTATAPIAPADLQQSWELNMLRLHLDDQELMPSYGDSTVNALQSLVDDAGAHGDKTLNAFLAEHFEDFEVEADEVLKVEAVMATGRCVLVRTMRQLHSYLVHCLKAGNDQVGIKITKLLV
jgi:hypothetical protein